MEIKDFKVVKFKDIKYQQKFSYGDSQYIKVDICKVKDLIGYIPPIIDKKDGHAFILNSHNNILGLVFFNNSNDVNIEIPTIELFNLQTGRDFKYKDRRYNLFHKPLLASEYCQVVSLEDSDKNDRLKMFPGTYQVIEL